MRMKKVNETLFNIFCIIFTILFLLSFTTLIYSIFKLNILPTKYLIIGFSVLILVTIILLFGIFSKKHKAFRTLSSIIMLLLTVFSCFAINYLNNTYNFINSTQNKYDTLNYSVIVLKDSNYTNIDSLRDKTVSYLNDSYNLDIKNELNSKITYREELVDDFTKMVSLLNNKDTDAIVLEDSYLTLIEEEDTTFYNNIKVVYTFQIKVKTHEESDDTIITQEPFILYISGIDQYGNVNTVRGRSDVNQLVVVNPKTNHILLVNTPRDYYVRLAGTIGLKDKLTHAGIYGINKSIDTLEDLYDININHYLRVNFNTLVKVVDVIGGIDVYSDKTFNSFHIKGWTVSKGLNHFNGKEALAYSRERYAYIDGDHHRGRNQQDVITAIINKITTSKVLISKYNSILNVLDGSFQTDISTSGITSFIKYQLDKMPSWKVESIAVSGYNSYNYTYSMGYNYKLYVMEPDYDSIETVKEKIKEVLNES